MRERRKPHCFRFMESAMAAPVSLRAGAPSHQNLHTFIFQSRFNAQILAPYNTWTSLLTKAEWFNPSALVQFRFVWLLHSANLYFLVQFHLDSVFFMSCSIHMHCVSWSAFFCIWPIPCSVTTKAVLFLMLALIHRLLLEQFWDRCPPDIFLESQLFLFYRNFLVTLVLWAWIPEIREKLKNLSLLCCSTVNLSLLI